MTNDYMTSISDTFKIKYPNIDTKLYTMKIGNLIDLNNFFEEFIKQYIYHIDSYLTAKANTDTTYYKNIAKHFEDPNYRIAFRDICAEILSPIMRYTLFFNFVINESNDLLVDTTQFNTNNILKSDVKKISLTYDTIINNDINIINNQDPNLNNFTFVYNGEMYRYTDILMSLVNIPDDQVDNLTVSNNKFDILSSPNIFYNEMNIYSIMLPILNSNRINILRKCQNVIFSQLHNLYTIYKKIDKRDKPKFSDYCRSI